jgi:hypothetical protein
MRLITKGQTLREAADRRKPAKPTKPAAASRTNHSGFARGELRDFAVARRSSQRARATHAKRAPWSQMWGHMLEPPKKACHLCG